MQVIEALGGPPPRGNRFTAWWRGSTDLNCSISKDGLQWFDHVACIGGDGVKLAQTVSGIGVGEVMRLLESRGLRTAKVRPRTRAEFAKATAERERQAKRAEDVELFRSGLDSELDVRKLAASDRGDDEALGLAASEQVRLRREPGIMYDELSASDPEALLRLIAAGRADIQHAAGITAAVVRLLHEAVLRDGE